MRTLPSVPPVIAGLDFVRPLGSGGFADVFLYAQDMPRRQVAVKVLPEALGDPARLRMFNLEADVLARLSAHPAIVTVYQAGISSDGRPYIVMEFCPDSLARSYRVERMPVGEVMEIAVRLAGALETAHQAGLLHRDIKPSNILITTFGAAVLADFGIAAPVREGTQASVLALSLPWSAPEVVRTTTAGTIASEVWALGATVYSLLAGHSPFERPEKSQNTREKLTARILRGAPAPIARADVPDALQRVLATAMAPQPAARFPSAAAFGEAVREVQRAAGLVPTALEIPTDPWQPHETDALDDDTARGPVHSRLADAPRRISREAAPPTRAAGRDEDGIVAPSRRRPATGTIVIGLVLAVVLTVGALAVAGVFG